MGLFLPLILGEAVEYGIIILVRWQQDKFARIITLQGVSQREIELLTGRAGILDGSRRLLIIFL